MNININLLLITSVISFSAFSAENSKPDYQQLLLNSCQSLTMNPEHEDAKACTYFIRGFIAAAQSIDHKAINKNNMKRKFSGTMSRPYRNWGQYSSHRYFPFCLPETISTAQIIKSVSKSLNSQFDTIEMLENEVLGILKSEYSCSKPHHN